DPAECEYRIDATQSPPHIDLISSGKVLSRGIYELKGDELTLCFSTPPEPRPKTFVTRRNTSLYITVLRREKSASDQDKLQKNSVNPGQMVYQRLLKSAALILVQKQIGNQTSMGLGAGTLIDKTNRLVLTVAHVVGKAERVTVFFPTFKDGKIISEPDYFYKAAATKEAIVGKVVFKDDRRNLALVQLERLPDGVEPLPLSGSRPVAAQRVYSL